jgi:hypothetical protein
MTPSTPPQDAAPMPCPLCNAAMRSERADGGRLRWNHPRGLCPAAPIVLWTQTNIERWNRRAPSASEATLREALEDARTPDMWWSQQEGLSPEETPIEDWRDECLNAGPRVICPVSAAKNLGTKWAVVIPTEDGGSWRDDCHIFDTEAEARAALSPEPSGGAR